MEVLVHSETNIRLSQPVQKKRDDKANKYRE